MLDLMVVHTYLFMMIIYKLFHFFIYRYLVYDLGMSYGAGELVTFILVAILGTLVCHLLFGHRHTYRRSRYYY